MNGSSKRSNPKFPSNQRRRNKKRWSFISFILGVYQKIKKIGSRNNRKKGHHLTEYIRISDSPQLEEVKSNRGPTSISDDTAESKPKAEIISPDPLDKFADSSASISPMAEPVTNVLSESNEANETNHRVSQTMTPSLELPIMNNRIPVDSGLLSNAADLSSNRHENNPDEENVPMEIGLKKLKDGFSEWLQTEKKLTNLSALWNITMLKNIPAEFDLPKPEYDFFQCSSIAELDNMITAYRQREYFDKYDRRFNGILSKAISFYREYYLTIESELREIKFIEDDRISRTHALINTKSDIADQHRLELKKFIIHENENVVYLPASSPVYRNLSSYAYRNGLTLEKYIESLGFERTSEKPIPQSDETETDMETRSGEVDFVLQAFAEYPLIGSKVLTPEERTSVLSEAKKIIDTKLENPSGRILPREKEILALALIQYSKDWDQDIHPKFWIYAAKQFGYYDKSERIERLLKDALEYSIQKYKRLFIENEKGRWFRGTAVLHAFAPRKSWMAFFDLLFDFYKSNLNWTIRPGEPLVEVMIQSLIRLFGSDDSEDKDIMISAKAYSIREGIRKLILLRPKYARTLAERLIRKIDSLVNARDEGNTTYEEQLCEEWFETKLTEIVNSTKSERERTMESREIILDYSKIRAKFRLKDENELQLILPEIRLLNGVGNDLSLEIYNGETLIYASVPEWYGNELGRTLKRIEIGLSAIVKNGSGNQIRIRLHDGDSTIYDSEERLYRSRFIFSEQKETTDFRIPPGNYTLIIPVSESILVERGSSTEISSIRIPGFRGVFVELESGFSIRIGPKIVCYDRNNIDTDFSVRSPGESDDFPRYYEHEDEFEFAYRTSVCQIILNRPEFSNRFVIRKNGERIKFSSLETDDEKKLYALPLDDCSDCCRIQILDLTEENLLFKRDFILIDRMRCEYNREFYFSSEDYRDARVKVELDEFSEEIEFSSEDDYVSIPFRAGELQIPIPKVMLHETTGQWLTELSPAWLIRKIPQASQLKLSIPSKISAAMIIGETEVPFDRNGTLAIGNILHSFSSQQVGDASFYLGFRIKGNRETRTYSVTRVFLKEGFLLKPRIWEEKNVLFWDKGGAFIGNSNRSFTLTLTSESDKSLEFKLDMNTIQLPLPDDTPTGYYRYKIYLASSNLFQKEKVLVAEGECIIGDKNLLRFRGKRICIRSITDVEKRIMIHPCYIDRIEYLGVQDTTEGKCPVYSGMLYRYKDENLRQYFSSEYSQDNRGIVRTKVNPVRVIYIGETTLSITDEEGDGFYYRKIYDDYSKTDYGLTDHEPTEQNRNRYNLVDLYSYTTERI